MINCIAVDDEPLALSLLADNISKIPFLNLVARCHDAFEAVTVLQHNQVDLVFIDIQMPGITGIQLIDSLQVKPMVIMITAYKEYALDGYNLNVIDYLLKPVAMSRFMLACNKALELFQLRNASKPSTPAPGKNTPDHFFLHVDYTQIKVRHSDIAWIEGLRDYVKIHLVHAQKPLVARMSIKALETHLPPDQFLRIHKSYLVSVHNITAVRKNSLFIADLELPVGETYREVIKNITGAV